MGTKCFHDITIIESNKKNLFERNFLIVNEQ